MTSNPLMEAALSYAARGWKVLPCHTIRKDTGGCSCSAGTNCGPAGKHPILMNPLEIATDSKDTIVSWWLKYPYANIGIACHRSGLLVVDVDEEGKATWREIVAELGREIELTATVETPGHGFHLYYEALRELQAIAQLGPGVDIRYNNYVIAPPSKHKSGGEYAWALGASPDECPLLELPFDLERRVQKEHHKVESLPSTIMSGQRNMMLASLAGTLRRRGLDEDAMRDMLLALNAQQCRPPLPEDEVAQIAKSYARYAPGVQRQELETVQRTQRAVVAQIMSKETGAPPSHDETLTMMIREEAQSRYPKEIRRERIGYMLQSWLAAHGYYVHSDDGTLYYFHSGEHKLYDMSTPQFLSFLYGLTSANPASAEFAYLLADCKMAACRLPQQQIIKVSFWDAENELLYVSRFDGRVFVIDGSGTPKEEYNGEHVLFYDDPLWQTYDPGVTVGQGSTPYEWLCGELPNWDRETSLPVEGYNLAMKCWILSTFFTELCPTRPILLLLGGHGSGKSMLLRMILQMLFGGLQNVMGVPDKPDGFTAAASGSHILVIDNVDDFTGWLRDKLARITTGAVDTYRRLYTNNSMGRVVYRVWLAMTARTPDTLRRDDLASRIIILPLKELSADKLRPEREFLRQIDVFRSWFWGATLKHLDEIVAIIRRDGLPPTSVMRMADWETICRLIARTFKQETLWNDVASKLRMSQSEFVIENDIIPEALAQWLEKEENHGRTVVTRELYDEMQKLVSDDKGRPPTDWPRSCKSFAKRWGPLVRELSDLYRIDIKRNSRLIYYSIWPK